MADYVLAIDQGTTGSTVALVDAQGQLCASVNVEFPQHYPQPGWVEHEPDAIWASVEKALGRLLRRKLCKPSEIACIGITNQRETVVLWDRRSGEAVHNAIVWQCRRTADFTGALKRDGHEALVRRRTGLLLDPYFSASKYRWLLDHVPAARRALKAGALAGGTIDSYLLWKLSGGAVHVTDVSNAARTSLMNLKTRRWDKDLLKLFGVPGEILPAIAPSSGLLGHTRGVRGLPDGIPITGVAGDQQAALFGQACFAGGDAKVHLRHRLLHRHEHGRGTRALARRPAQHRGLADRGGRRAGLRARGRRLCLRRRGAVAARRPAVDQACTGRRGAGGVGAGPRWRRVRAGADGARCAALGTPMPAA
jgi:glycerol kinase